MTPDNGKRGGRHWDAPRGDQFPELLPELKEPAPPPEPGVEDLLTSKSGAGIAARTTLTAVLAALYLQYYFYDVQKQILQMPAIMVNVPPRAGAERVGYISVRTSPAEAGLHV